MESVQNLHPLVFTHQLSPFFVVVGLQRKQQKTWLASNVVAVIVVFVEGGMTQWIGCGFRSVDVWKGEAGSRGGEAVGSGQLMFGRGRQDLREQRL